MVNFWVISTFKAFVFTALFYLVMVSFIGYPVTTVLKPVPIVFLIMAVAEADLKSIVRLMMFSALGFSLLGDVILTLPLGFELELGITCFVLAHCSYIFLFLKSFKYNRNQLFYFTLLFLIMCYILFLVLEYLGELQFPILIYFSVLMTMVFSAFHVNREGVFIKNGALFFLFSDSLLAIDLFIYHHILGSVAIMFTYYVAQFLLIYGLLRIYTHDHANC